MISPASPFSFLSGTRMICKFCKRGFRSKDVRRTLFCSRPCCKGFHSRTKKKRETDRLNYIKNRKKRIACSSAWKLKNRLRASISKYGLSVTDYQALLRKQKGGCAVCRTHNPKDRRSKFFRVDHCHKTGKVRGLLCGRCNVGIGMFKDSPRRLRNAVKYVQGFRSPEDM